MIRPDEDDADSDRDRKNSASEGKNSGSEGKTSGSAVAAAVASAVPVLVPRAPAAIAALRLSQLRELANGSSSSPSSSSSSSLSDEQQNESSSSPERIELVKECTLGLEAGRISHAQFWEFASSDSRGEGSTMLGPIHPADVEGPTVDQIRELSSSCTTCAAPCTAPCTSKSAMVERCVRGLDAGDIPPLAFRASAETNAVRRPAWATALRMARALRVARLRQLMGPVSSRLKKADLLQLCIRSLHAGIISFARLREVTDLNREGTVPDRTSTKKGTNQTKSETNAQEARLTTARGAQARQAWVMNIFQLQALLHPISKHVTKAGLVERCIQRLQKGTLSPVKFWEMAGNTGQGRQAALIPTTTSTITHKDTKNCNNAGIPITNYSQPTNTHFTPITEANKKREGTNDTAAMVPTPKRKRETATYSAPERTK